MIKVKSILAVAIAACAILMNHSAAADWGVITKSTIQGSFNDIYVIQTGMSRSGGTVRVTFKSSMTCAPRVSLRSAWGAELQVKQGTTGTSHTIEFNEIDYNMADSEKFFIKIEGPLMKSVYSKSFWVWTVGWF